MKTIRQRYLPALMLVVICGLVAGTVSRVSAKDKQDDWEAAITEVKVMSMHLEMYGQLVGLISDMNEIHESPTASAEMAIMGLDDHLGLEERAEFLEDMLKDTEDATVRRAIRTKLIDTYKELGDSEEAMEHIEALITAEDE